MPPKRKLSSLSGSPDKKKGTRLELDSLSHRTSSSVSKLTWPGGWETFNDGERKECMLQSMSARFKCLRIEVEELCGSPELIHLISEPSEEQETFTVQKITNTCAGELREWLIKGGKEKLRKKNMFLDALTEGMESVTFDAVDETWYGRSLEKAKDDKATKTGDRRKNAPADRLEKHFTKELLSNFVVGVLHKMTNSKGLQFVESLLNAALYVSLDENNFSDNSWILNISSKTKDEGFPLQVSSPSHKQVVRKLDALARGKVKSWSLAASTPSTPSTPAEAAEGSSSGISRPLDSSSVHTRGTESGEPHCSGYVFPDLLVTSMLHSSTKCLLVVEVTSKSITTKEHSQLFRQMIGAGMHQTIAFGLLINSLEANIWKMDVDKTQKFVTFSQMLSFSLCRKSELLNLFQYLISIFDYMYNNVSEVKHE